MHLMILVFATWLTALASADKFYENAPRGDGTLLPMSESGAIQRSSWAYPSEGTQWGSTQTVPTIFRATEIYGLPDGDLPLPTTDTQSISTKGDAGEESHFAPDQKPTSSSPGKSPPPKSIIYGSFSKDAKQVPRKLSRRGQAITGIPDLSDPCFRRYANSIIVNAQPYERRSSVSIDNCKKQCISSQIAVYSCRSFVYDNVHQVCDLFAHVGDQAPARLLRFQSRDYFEPLASTNCRIAKTQIIDAEQSYSTGSATLANEMRQRREQAFSVSRDLLPCSADQISCFMKTTGFELFGHDDVRLSKKSREECQDICLNHFAGNNKTDNTSSTTKCNSFEFSSDGDCILSHERAVPLGNGQLKERSGIDYYEMILVGFAEAVVDAPSLQHCFDSCLSAKLLYNFTCLSGMFYFEESHLNCILNTEARSTQAELFTGEYSDLVDYFETECNTNTEDLARQGKRASETPRRRRVDKREGLPNEHYSLHEKLLPHSILSNTASVESPRHDRGIA